MHPLRPLVQVCLVSLIVALILALGRPMAALGWLPPAWDGLRWGPAHGVLMAGGVLLPGLFAAHLHAVSLRTGTAPRSEAIRSLAATTGAGAALAAVAGLGIASWSGAPRADEIAMLVAGLVLTIAALLQIAQLRSILPKGTLVDAAQPLTKGDDASLKHVRMAHFFLPAGLLLWALGAVLTGTAGHRMVGAGAHLGLAAYATLSTYGLAHLMVPRYSGVPAIAAGAIKGELHSSLLGFTLLVAAFLTGTQTSAGKGLLVAGGSFLFLGVFTFMGVLGANIMKNKSRTQRVTPEFVYVPWVFAGVFWLISGLLLGMFLNAVPDLLADQAPALRFLHIHATLAGGVLILFIGLAHRAVPAMTGRAPPSFSSGRFAFLGTQSGLAILVLAAFQARASLMLVGILLVGVGLASSLLTLRRHAMA